MAGHLNIGMSQHFSNTLYGNTICQSKRGESVAGHMGRQCFLNATNISQFFEIRIQKFLLVHYLKLSLRVTKRFIFHNLTQSEIMY